MEDAAILRHAWVAGQFYIRNRSAALCFEYAQDDIEGGSAVCVEIANRLFIATVAHNFNRLRQVVKWSVFSANRSSNHELNILQANYCKERDQDEPDLAWLEIDPASAQDSDLSGIDIRDILVHPDLNHGELYLATGFPVDLKQIAVPNEHGHRSITIPLGVYFTTVVEQAVAAVQGELIVLDYQREGIDINGQIVEIEPHGMSGGGVWFTPVREAQPMGVWNPRRLKLLGLSREYFRYRHHLTAEPMQKWLTLLRNDLPELQAAIDPVLER